MAVRVCRPWRGTRARKRPGGAAIRVKALSCPSHGCQLYVQRGELPCHHHPLAFRHRHARARLLRRSSCANRPQVVVTSGSLTLLGAVVGGLVGGLTGLSGTPLLQAVAACSCAGAALATLLAVAGRRYAYVGRYDARARGAARRSQAWLMRGLGGFGFGAGGGVGVGLPRAF